MPTLILGDYGCVVTTTPLDWKLAQDTAARLARPGPKASLVERRELVADLRMAAAAAPEIVAQTALLKPAQQAQVRVVDRANWSRSVISGLSAMIGSAIPTTTPDRKSTRLNSSHV